MPGGNLVRTYDPNAVLQLAFRRFFDHIQIDETWVKQAKDAAGRGPVVYVMRNLSFLDFMALDHLTHRYGLPGLGFANDLGLWVLEPFAETWSEALLNSHRIPPKERLTDVIENGGSAALFLKRPPTILEKATQGRRRAVSSEGDTLVKSLFDLQRRMDRPIMLVPQVFVWSQRPESLEPSMMDFVLGPRDWPGRIRLATQFLLNYKHVMLRAGEPIALSDFLRDNPGETEETLVRRGTYALLRKLERERRAVLGPMRKPTDRVRDEIIRTPKLAHTIRQLAGEGKAERMLLTARAYRMLSELEAAPDPETIFAMSKAVQGILNVLYAGLEVDKEGIERVRQAAQRGTLVLLPSHKSHIDYLLLSHVLHMHSLQLPLIAAGDNLSFFPAGPILRRGGAFFIRRTFRGDRLYAAVVDAYLRRILRDGWPIEVFLEGTRSRTGKLLPPKLGLFEHDRGVGLEPGQPGRAVRPGEHRLRAARRGGIVRARAPRGRQEEGGHHGTDPGVQDLRRTLRPPEPPVWRNPQPQGARRRSGHRRARTLHPRPTTRNHQAHRLREHGPHQRRDRRPPRAPSSRSPC